MAKQKQRCDIYDWLLHIGKRFFLELTAYIFTKLEISIAIKRILMYNFLA